MDTALITGIVAARAAQVQFAVAARMMKMNAEAAQSVVALVDAGRENMQRLTEAALGLGGNVDISV
jgi:hypothetical protein